MPDDAIATDIRGTWESAAPGWAKWEDRLGAALAGVTGSLIDMAGVRPGMAVLDLACGAGVQSLELARRVGPSGRVLAVDIAPTMLRYVAANAHRAGLDNIATLESAAEDLDPGTGPFDAAVCRLGVMLFPAPPRALAAVRAALAPGARFAALVFASPAGNPFMAQSLAILLKHAGRQPPPPGKPGIFALAAEGALPGLLRDAGFDDIRSQVAQARLDLADADEALTMMQQAFGVYRAVVADLDPDRQARAWDEVRGLLEGFETGAGFRAGLEFVIAAGARKG